MSDLVPEGWVQTRIGKVSKLQGGYAFKSTDSAESGIRWLKIANVGIGRVKWADKSFLPKSFESQYADFILNDGDSVVALTRPIIGGELKVAQIGGADTPALLNQRVARINPNPKLINRDFLYSLFRYEQISKEIVITIYGTDPPNVSTKQIEDIKFHLPPLPEQQKIAAILSSVDEVIEKTQAQINKLKDLKIGMMQELLSPREGQAANINSPQGESKNSLHHTEFKDSPLGRIPVGWEVVSVGSVADVIDPQPDHRTPPEVEGGIPYIGLGDINKSGLINFSNARKVSLDAFNKQLNSFVIHPKAFIFGKIGTIGNPSILPERRFYCLSANIILITTSNIETMEYLYQVFTSGVINQQVAMQTNTTSQPALGIKKVRDFLIPIPSDINEQKTIVKTLSSIDKKIVLINEKLMSLNDTKKALMQDLLTGKVRVKLS
jgi:type I restriction enzyme S subunit